MAVDLTQFRRPRIQGKPKQWWWFGVGPSPDPQLHHPQPRHTHSTKPPTLAVHPADIMTARAPRSPLDLKDLLENIEKMKIKSSSKAQRSWETGDWAPW